MNRLLPAGFCLAIFFWLVLNATIFHPLLFQDHDIMAYVWMAKHLNFSNPETLANANYPGGYPLLLALLYPLYPKFLVLAKLISAFASLFHLGIFFLLARRLTPQQPQLCLFVLVIYGLNERFHYVATSELPDVGVGGLLLLSVLLLLKERHLLAGAAMGFSYNFRWHSLTYLLVTPAVLYLLDPASGRRAKILSTLKRFSFVLLGFVLGALPILIVSLHLGEKATQSWMPGAYAMGFNWHHFDETYNRYPLGILLTQHLPEFLKYWMTLFFTKYAWRAGLVFLPLFLLWHKKFSDEKTFQAVKGLSALILLYCLACATSQISWRATAPVWPLVFLIGGPVLSTLLNLPGEKWRPAPAKVGALRLWPSRGGVYTLFLLLYGIINLNNTLTLQAKGEKDKIKPNLIISQSLRSHGMKNPGEVLTARWDHVYLLGDQSEGYYNWGGFLTFDPNWRSQRPSPKLRTLGDLKTFMRKHHLRFLILTHEMWETAGAGFVEAEEASRQKSLGPDFNLILEEGDALVFQRID